MKIADLHQAIDAKQINQVKHLLENGIKPDSRAGVLAIKRKNPAILRMIVEAGLPLNEIDYHGFTPLMRAVFSRNDKLVQILLDAGASPDFQSAHGLPLVQAAVAGQTSTIELLLKSGAQIDLKNKSRYEPTALIEAAKFGRTEIVKLLLQAGANPAVTDADGSTAYDTAVRIGHQETAGILAKAARRKHDIPDTSAADRLNRAIVKGDRATFSRLVAGKIDLNAADRTGFTPLNQAIECGASKFAVRLIEAGCAVNDVFADDISPLVLAVERELISVVEALLKAGASPSASEIRNADPLKTAAATGNAEMVKLFLNAGAEPNAADIAGETAIFSAIRAGALEAIKLLIVRGANVNHADRQGWTPLFWTVNITAVPKLVERSFDKPADFLDTPREEAARPKLQNHRIIKLLLDNGADVNHADIKGRTAVTYATTEHAARLLVSAGAELNTVDWGKHPVSYWLKRTGIELSEAQSSKINRRPSGESISRGGSPAPKTQKKRLGRKRKES